MYPVYLCPADIQAMFHNYVVIILGCSLLQALFTSSITTSNNGPFAAKCPY